MYSIDPHPVRTSGFPPAAAEATDRELLVRFAERRDERAFAVLVSRYGGLVRGAGLRTAGQSADAEDAVQAAFLALAKHAARLTDRMGPDQRLGGWLYRVAVNAVLQQKRRAKSRGRREASFAADGIPRDANPADACASADTLALLDEELAGLPRRYRDPLILCHLEGRTQREAAAALGLTYGTFRRRLDDARDLLRGRLTRRGVAPAGTLFAAWSAASVATAAAVRPDEAVLIAADVARGLPPRHVLAPRVAAPSARPIPGASFPGWFGVVRGGKILSSAASVAVAVLAVIGLFDLLSSFTDGSPDPSERAEPAVAAGAGVHRPPESGRSPGVM